LANATGSLISSGAFDRTDTRRAPGDLNENGLPALHSLDG
jgi:hypothetical protein